MSKINELIKQNQEIEDSILCLLKERFSNESEIGRLAQEENTENKSSRQDFINKAKDYELPTNFASSFYDLLAGSFRQTDKDKQVET